MTYIIFSFLGALRVLGQKRVFKQNLKELIYCRVNLQILKSIKPMKPILYTIAFFMMMSLNAQKLSVMTYNIKLDHPKEGENSWENRRPFMIGQIQFYDPDILGVQEAMPNQMRDMDRL